MPNSSNAADRKFKPPLVVDLDGALIKRDLFVFQALNLVKSNPLVFFRVFVLAIFGSKQRAKQLAASSNHGDFTLEDLQPNTSLIQYLTQQSGQRDLWIASGATQENVDYVLAQLDIFKGGFGSSNGINLVGEKKGKLLADYFGVSGFDYIGHSRADLRLRDFARTVTMVHDLTGEIHSPRERLKTFLAAMRINHWLKNALIAVPMLAAHEFSTFSSWIAVGILILCFSLASSSGYLINDLLDLRSDAKHPEKRKRPIASGALSIANAGLLSGALLVLSMAISLLLLGPIGAILVSIYLVASLLYSIFLKRLLLIDVAALASLFVFRIAAGVIITGVNFSTWLFAFAWLFFLGLAIMKRAIENAHVSEETDFGRAYQFRDNSMLFNLGTASSFSAVLVLVIYATSIDAQAQYANPQLLVLALPIVLFWSARAWLLANRGEIQADPVDWAIRDKHTLWLAAATLLIFIIAS